MSDLPEDIRNLLHHAGFDPDTGIWRGSDPATGVRRIEIEEVPRTAHAFYVGLKVGDAAVGLPSHQVRIDDLPRAIDDCRQVVEILDRFTDST